MSENDSMSSGSVRVRMSSSDVHGDPDVGWMWRGGSSETTNNSVVCISFRTAASSPSAAMNSRFSRFRSRLLSLSHYLKDIIRYAEFSFIAADNFHCRTVDDWADCVCNCVWISVLGGLPSSNVVVAKTANLLQIVMFLQWMILREKCKLCNTQYICISGMGE